MSDILNDVSALLATVWAYKGTIFLVWLAGAAAMGLFTLYLVYSGKHKLAIHGTGDVWAYAFSLMILSAAWPVVVPGILIATSIQVAHVSGKDKPGGIRAAKKEP